MGGPGELISATEIGPAAIAGTIWLTLLAYFAAMTLILARAPGGSDDGRSARRWWTLAVVAYLLHVAAAFHFHHRWSHDRAYQMVQEQSGFGPGIFITYFFTLIWMLDAGWWWLAPASRERRPRWLEIALHAFLAFILFNGAVVFEGGPVRWLSLAGFTTLGVMLWKRWRRIGARVSEAA
jgi:hypothetical protein